MQSYGKTGDFRRIVSRFESLECSATNQIAWFVISTRHALNATLCEIIILLLRNASIFDQDCETISVDLAV